MAIGVHGLVAGWVQKRGNGNQRRAAVVGKAGRREPTHVVGGDLEKRGVVADSDRISGGSSGLPGRA